jgi:hypothetical protein
MIEPEPACHHHRLSETRWREASAKRDEGGQAGCEMKGNRDTHYPRWGGRFAGQEVLPEREAGRRSLRRRADHRHPI